MKDARKIIVYKDYFLDFYDKQTNEVQQKIEWTLRLIEVIDKLPAKYFDHITGTHGLYEIRVEYAGNIYRIFAFFDSGNRMILANGFQKKQKKTPKSEIKIALQIKSEYERETE